MAGQGPKGRGARPRPWLRRGDGWVRGMVGLLALLALGVAGGFALVGAPEAHGEEAALYTCAMHPHVLEESPGACPICGMDLVPRRLGGGGASQSGGITIDPVVVQNMGVRTAEVKAGGVHRDIPTAGVIRVPEDGVQVVNLRVSGWVEHLYVDTTGAYVEKGDPLLRLYSPEVVATQEELVLALKAGGEASPLVQSTRRRLTLMGIPEWHINQVTTTGDGQRLVTLPAPSSGYVLRLALKAGGRVEAGQDLYEIGTLTPLWIEGEIHPYDGPFVHVGQPARVDVPGGLGAPLSARVDFVHPTADPRTGALRVRLTLDTPTPNLRPGMVVGARLEAEAHGGLVIPSEAILYTGESPMVFVATTLGHYEPREVRLGMVGDNGLTEVTGGIVEGEVVVTSGQFLLDAESQLQEALAKMSPRGLQAGPGRPPAVGGGVAPKGDEGPRVYRCPLHSGLIEAGAPGICPIDGLDLVEGELPGTDPKVAP